MNKGSLLKNNIDESNGLLVCPVCGKRFVYNSRSIYVMKDKSDGDKKIYTCGYNCINKIKHRNNKVSSMTGY